MERKMKKEKPNFFLVLICVSVVLAVSIVIGFLYVSHRKTQFLLHSGWKKSFDDSNGKWGIFVIENFVRRFS